MSHTLVRPPPVLFMPQKQPAKPMTRRLKVVSEYEPAGDQPAAIRELVRGVQALDRDQVLLGVTGSGKTFTMAKVIEEIQKPTLVLAPNKTLAAQLYGEMKSFFPDNAVEYFVSYYDYYQPEAYIPHNDIYIEKDSSINEDIDRLRLSATSSLMGCDMGPRAAFGNAQQSGAEQSRAKQSGAKQGRAGRKLLAGG